MWNAGNSGATWVSWRRVPLQSWKCAHASGPRPSLRLVREQPRHSNCCLLTWTCASTRGKCYRILPSGACVLFHVRLWQELKSRKKHKRGQPQMQPKAELGKHFLCTLGICSASDSAATLFRSTCLLLETKQLLFGIADCSRFLYKQFCISIPGFCLWSTLMCFSPTADSNMKCVWCFGN